MTRAGATPGGSPGEFTVCELAEAVASGNAAAMPALLRQLHAPVTSYCRARARAAGRGAARPGADRNGFGTADELALDVCRAVLAELASPGGPDGGFLRFTYRIASAAADTRFGCSAPAALTRTQQEILILRTIIGLDPVQTGVALGVTPGRVRAEQHAALRSFRAA